MFSAIKSGAAKAFVNWFSRVIGSNWIMALFLLPLTLNLVFSHWYPRQTNALYDDPAWFFYWASWYALGFLISHGHSSAIGTILRIRRRVLAISITLTIVLYLTAWTPVVKSIGDPHNMTLFYKVIVMAFAWSMILTLMGYFARYANTTNRFLVWANKGIFPFYIIHQTIVVAALYYILPIDTGIWTKYALVAIITFGGSAIFFEIVRRLPATMHSLFGISGMKKLPQVDIVKIYGYVAGKFGQSPGKQQQRNWQNELAASIMLRSNNYWITEFLKDAGWDPAGPRNDKILTNHFAIC